MKVSVVVAAYNGGPLLRGLVKSLDAQTMSKDDFELIVVDDGSTDDTLEILEELAATRSYMVVETIPASGWPGRPRNVGSDLARGEYIYFSDQDDAFGPRALEVVHDCATKNGSDIVYGKLVRKGRQTPYWSVWREDIAQADRTGAVATSRTVHKLYRRGFLVENGIRFIEGRIRLEDHEFMAQALPRARTVSVVASEPCYYWIHRTDGTNNSSNPVEPAVYWGHYANVLRTWERTAGPGPLLDAARLVAAQLAFAKFSASRWLSWPADKRKALFDAVHPMIRDHLPAELDPQLPVLKRLRLQALRTGDLARFHRLQEVRRGYSFRMSTSAVSWHGSRLRMVVEARCVGGFRGRVVVPDAADDRLLLPLPADISASDDDRALIHGDHGTVEFSLRHRTTGVEWPVASQRSTGDARRGLGVTTDAEIDLRTNAFGGALEPGVWNLLVRVQFLGETTIRRPEAPGGGIPAMPAALREEGYAAYVAKDGGVSIRVPAEPGTPDDRTVRSVAWHGRRLRVELIRGSGKREILARRRGADQPARSFAVVDDSALVDVDVDPVAGASILDLWVRDSRGVKTRLAYDAVEVTTKVRRQMLTAYATHNNCLAVKREPTAAVPVTSRVRDRLRKEIRKRWPR